VFKNHGVKCFPFAEVAKIKDPMAEFPDFVEGRDPKWVYSMGLFHLWDTSSNKWLGYWSTVHGAHIEKLGWLRSNPENANEVKFCWDPYEQPFKPASKGNISKMFR